MRNSVKYIMGKILLVLLPILFLTISSAAQIQQPVPGQAPFGNPIDSFMNRKMDSIPMDIPLEVRKNMHFIYFDNARKLLPFSDTTLLGFHQDLPEENRFISYQNLGFPGSAGKALYYDPLFVRGWRSGISVYDHQMMGPEMTPFLKVGSPFASMRYTQRGTQANNHFEGLFAAPFANGIHANIRLVNLNHDGTYTNQQTKNNHFHFALTQKKDTSAWTHYFAMTFNNFSHNENGGITTDSLFDTPFNQFRTDIPVYLRNAGSKYAESHIYLKSELEIDFFEESKFLPVLSGKLERVSRNFLFADAEVNSQEKLDYYGEYIVDIRGVRQSLKSTTWIGALSLTGLIEREGKDFRIFDAGLEFRSNDISQEGPFETNIAELFVRGDLDIPVAFAGLKAEGWYRLPNNRGTDLYVAPSLMFDFSRFGILEAGVFFRARPPAQLEQMMVVTQRLIYDNTLNSEVYTGFTGSYINDHWNLKMEARGFRVDNYIYFDRNFLPKQVDFAVNVLQLRLKHHFRTRWIFMENQIALQQADNEIIGIPPYWLQNTFGLTQMLFRKRFELRLGYNIVLMPSFKSYGYAPVAASFYYQSDQWIGFYPVSDLFASFKISDFRFSVSAENASSFILPRAAFPTVNYPERDWQLRISIGWMLWN